VFTIKLYSDKIKR